ncbi:MAG: PaaI family thioesterase [bacterium]
MTPPIDQSWSHCFACGPAEAHGLRLQYRFLSTTSITASATFDARFQGFDGVIHGGILATALDDAMANIACLQGERAMTVELTARFKSPVRVGETVQVRAEVVRRKGRLMECRAWVEGEDGAIKVEGSGKFMIVGALG